jgi:arylsulfatase A-like enzyme
LAGLGSVVLLALGSVACSGEPEGRFIGLIVLDAARPDRFSCYGYPRRTTPEIDRLGAEGMVFLDHFSQHTSTRGAVPKMLFSRYYTPAIFPTNAKVALESPEDLFRRADSASASLPRLLSGAGFHTALFSAHTWMRPGTPIADEFDEVHDLSTLLDYPQVRGFPDARMVVDHLLAWLETEAERHPSLFVYLHLMDTHFPHYLDPDARRLLEQSGLTPAEIHSRWEGYVDRQQSYFSSRRRITAGDRAIVDAIYDGSLRFADRELGRLVRRLEDGGEYERTLWALTSDHGEMLGEVPGRFGHGGPWFDLVARVPLILSGDGVPAGRFEHLSEHVDLNPTLLAAAGLPAPGHLEFDGVDLLEIARGEAPPKEYVIGWDAIRGRRYKAIFERFPAAREASAVAGRLFDLDADPLEREDLWGAEPAVAERMIGAFLSRMRPRLRRYSDATANEQPRSAFGVGALHFELAGDTPSPPAAATEGTLWHLDAGWPNFHLLVRPGGAVDIRFRIPDGAYRVSVTFAGRGTLGVGGGPGVVELAGPPPAPDRPARDMDKETFELGEITVAGTLFRARARGWEDGEGLLIRRFGFEPLGVAAAPAIDLEAEKRLRSLGYIDP